MLSRWVTSSYSPPDDVMGSNCNDVASGPGAQERRKKEEKKRKELMGDERRGEEWSGQHIISLPPLVHANLVS